MGRIGGFDMTDDGSIIMFTAQSYNNQSNVVVINNVINSNNNLPKNWYTSIACNSNGKVILVSGSNSFYKSMDGGNTWQQINSSIIQNLNSERCPVAVSSDGTKFVIGTRYLYSSLDSGLTWTQIGDNVGYRYIRISTNSNTLLAANDGNIYINTAGGNWANGWNKITPTNYSWGGISMSPNGQNIIATTQDSVSISNDSGKTWNKNTGVFNMKPKNQFPLAACAISDDGLKLTVVPKGWWVYTSVDGGKTWNERTNNQKLTGDPNRWHGNINYGQSNSSGSVVLLGSWDTFSSLVVHKIV
jgi:photosystem II stability/assembly factor-like uncharacterized protein